jgi:hypothetical protein
MKVWAEYSQHKALSKENVENIVVQSLIIYHLIVCLHLPSHLCPSISVHLLRVVCSLLQPFMPAFTAKVARQLNLPLAAFDLYFTELVIDSAVLPVGHELGEVVPIFRRIEAAEVEALRLRYAGSQVHAAQNAQQSAAAAAAAGASSWGTDDCECDNRTTKTHSNHVSMIVYSSP